MSFTGYSTEMFISPPDKSLICAICLEVLCDPSQCPNGHLFCRNCALAAIEYRRVCPTCRCSFDRSNLSMSLLARDVIGKSQVFCTLGKAQPGDVVSCNWKGPLNYLSSHIEDNCPLHIIKCSLQECTMRTPRHAMAAHMERCTYRYKECLYCGKIFASLSVNEHYKCCRFRPINCPNRCRRQSFRYCDMYAHLHKECPDELVPCKYYPTGCNSECTGQVKRKDCYSHLQDKRNMTLAITGLFNKVEELQDEISMKQGDRNTSAYLALRGEVEGSAETYTCDRKRVCRERNRRG